MIKVKIENLEDEYTIDVTGHANYSEYGKDIVCSAVTAILTYTYNLIEEFNLCYNIKKFSIDEGKFFLKIIKNNTINTIISVLENALLDIENQYKKNIKILKNGGNK